MHAKTSKFRVMLLQALYFKVCLDSPSDVLNTSLFEEFLNNLLLIILFDYF